MAKSMTHASIMKKGPSSNVNTAGILSSAQNTRKHHRANKSYTTMSIIEKVKQMAAINAYISEQEQKTAKTEYDYFFEKGRKEALDEIIRYIDKLS